MGGTMKGDFRPALQEEVIYRPQDQLQLFTNEVVNNTVPRLSQSVVCAPFRKFGIYIYIDSTGGSAQLLTKLHIEVEFLDPWTGRWYTHKQGLFASLFYEYVDTASGIWECFTGDVLGRAMRVKLTGVLTEATAYFTVSIGADFWN